MTEERSFTRRLPAGLLDSAFASLATFAVGLAAVSLLDDVSRGVYAVFFTAFFLGTLLPHQLIFTPAEVEAVSYPTPERLSLLPQSLRLGLLPALAGMVAAVVALAATASYADRDVALALAVTVAITIVLSPMQDHVRRMLHIATISWKASWVSMVQFAVVAVCLAGSIVVDLPPEWVPFGALAVANAVSLTVGLAVSRSSAEARSEHRLRFTALASRGVWYVLNAVAPALAGFVIAASIAWLASPEDLGYTESARVVAQPILVFATGLSAVLVPRSMRAAMDLDRRTARQTSRIFLASIAVAGAAYLVIAGWDWVLNPMSYIVPSAYVLPGLVALTIVANTVGVASFLQSGELMGAQRERTLASIAWATSSLAVLGGFTASVTGAYARSIGALAGAIAQYVTQARVLDRDYAARTQDATTPAPTREAEPGANGPASAGG